MIVFIFGKDSYLVHKRYQKYLNEFKEKDPNAHLDLIDFDDGGESRDLSLLLESGGGLFSQKKCVVIKNPFSLAVASQRKIAESLQKIEKDENLFVLVVEMQKQKPAGILLKFFKESAIFEYQQTLKQNDLQQWIEKEVESRGGKEISIKKDAVRMLAEFGNDDMWFLDREIEKLVNYVSMGEITKENIETLCRGSIDVGIFDLVDAIGANDKSNAIRLKNKLISQGENEFYVLATILSQFRNLLKVMECLKKGISDQKEIAKRCAMHPFVARKSLAQLRGFSHQQLKNAFGLVAEIDRKTKRGEIDINEALDYFIVKM